MLVKPNVFFFPGAIGVGDFWSPVAERLPSDWDMALLDWPGAGAVAAAPEVTGYRDLIELAAGAVPDGCDVVAHSMGGVVAIGLALAQPQKIRRLVLVATSGGLDVGRLGGSDWRIEYCSEFPQAEPWVTHDHVDYTAMLGEVEPPVCLIWGDADPISPVAVGRELDVRLPRSSLHVIAGGTHSLARDHPDQVAALIEAHLIASAPA